MCGRFTLTIQDQEQLAKLLGAEADTFLQEHYRPRYNIAPTDDHWIVRVKQERRELLPAKWGLVNSWAGDAKGAARQINARAETAHTRAAFRDAFQSRRCVVPADGYYEWTGRKDARQPHWFHRPGREVFLMAGLYETWFPAEGERRRTFTILTTTPNTLSLPIHDRMPAILPTDDAIDAWLYGQDDPAALRELLAPAPDDYLVVSRVSPRVNSVKNDDPELLVEQQALL